MRSLGLLAGLAAVLAGLVLAGGEAIVAQRTAHANGALDGAAAPLSQNGTPYGPGFFAGAGLTSPL